ncbi:murein L,D-transpeptidase [Synechococcus sp. RSCCF101]|uniref:L,D-transpeptidase n=1 Tax=Synechococcus sp. RSCCF101 TaxID=2511069 RepID=UPI0012461A17|nr:L,D-transpeptidase [Synechococcus sp. RSCCF101]QEY32087.1 murein L,D-transpeptidase [Synechococcus sp. RSCCF101]
MLELIASIVVDLSDQTLTAYDQQNVPVRVIQVSTGAPASPTPTGQGQVHTKYRSVTMRGRGFVAPGVPWAMCVTRNETICIHAAPWQEQAGQSFGVPRSHGCVRMPTREARWLFERTPKGTPVTIQV